jgi:hypothetical protein
VTECQGCGAWNDTSRTLCVLCGTPLAEIDEWDAAAELPPLPPLPDGGLHASMPSWLREPPAPIIANAPSLAPADPDVAMEQVVDLASLGSRADPRTFLSDDDFPQWLRDLSARREETTRRSVGSSVEPALLGAVERRAPSSRPAWSGTPASTPAPANASTHQGTAPPAMTQSAPESDSTSGSESEPEREAAPATSAPAAPVAAGPSGEHRGRDIWQTLLLVLLFIGVIAAALWALVANGVFDFGL